MDRTSLKKYLTIWNLLYFVIGVVILIYLVRKIDFAGLIQWILKIRPEFLILGGLIYLCKAAARSTRFTRINLRTNPGYIKMLRLSLASSLASQILPFKLGELSYVYLLKKDNRASIPQGISTLMVIRIFDLLAIAVLFIIISLVIGLQKVSVYFYSILAFTGILFAFILSLLIAAKNSEKFFRFIFQFDGLQKIPLIQKVIRGVQAVFECLQQYSGREYLEWTGLASLEWLINYATYYVILVGIGLSPTFFDTVVGVTFAALASVLPVSSFGGFGTLEAGWASGLILLGYSQEIAIASGFATHFVTLGYMVLFGGVSWLTYLVSQKPALDKQQGL
jgi:glycosyltransferase 2 family protein